METLFCARNAIIATTAAVSSLLYWEFRRSKRLVNQNVPAVHQRNQRDATIARVAYAALALTLAVTCGVMLATGKTPIDAHINGCRESILLTIRLLTPGAEIEQLESAAKIAIETQEMVNKLQECNGDPVCFDEIRDKLHPFLGFWHGLSQTNRKMSETTETRETFEHFEKFVQGIMNHKPTEENRQDTAALSSLLISMIFNDVPDHVRNQLQGDMQAITLAELTNLGQFARNATNRMRMANKSARSALNNLEYLAFMVGNNRAVNSWRQTLEMWGFSTDESLLLIGFLGSHIPSQAAFVNALVRHYVKDAYSSITSVDEWNGMTPAVFLARIHLGGGTVYFFHVFKIMVTNILLPYYCAIYAIMDWFLNELRHNYERTQCNTKIPTFQRSDMESWRFVAVTSIRLLFKSMSLVCHYYTCFFFVSNTCGVAIGLVINFARYFVDFAVPLWLPANELGPIFATLAVHIKAYRYALLCQLLFAALHFCAHYNRKHFKKIESAANFDYYKNRPNSTHPPEYTKAKEGLEKWTRIGWFLIILNWAQPLLAVLLKNVISHWFRQSGHLNFADGGVNYLWSFSDMSTIPAAYFEL